MTAPLIEHHVLEYPGGYTRSIGPALSRYLGGLRDGRIVGVRLADGRVMVPPTEYDPITAAALDEYVEVGPAGTVTAWTWVPSPVRASTTSASRSRSRWCGPTAPTPRWCTSSTRRRTRSRSACGCSRAGGPSASGYVTDLEAWVPAGRRRGARRRRPRTRATARPTSRSPGSTRRSGSSTTSTQGSPRASTCCGLAEHKILGARAEDSDQVYVPPRGSDPTTGAPTTIEVEVADTGTVTTFCVVNIPGLSESAPEIPYVCAQILLDGGNTPWFGLIQGLPAEEVRMGLRVHAIWAEELKADASNIKWFEPTGEPDADYDTYKAYA